MQTRLAGDSEPYPGCIGENPRRVAEADGLRRDGRRLCSLPGTPGCIRLRAMATLYYGDNLDILRHHLQAESVDLAYLDPPFNSAQSYNVLFQEKDGAAAASQICAFEDTWQWNLESERAYQELVIQPGKVSEVMQAFRTFLGPNDMMAYLAMMAPRLVELRRVLKPTDFLYPCRP